MLYRRFLSCYNSINNYWKGATALMKKIALLLMLALCMTITPALTSAEDQPYMQIRLNEALASCSSKVLQDENGNSPDWIELYNAGDAAVSLKGFSLSDSTKNLDKFVFPDLSIPAKGYLLIYCSGEDRITETELHTSFKLSADGETLILSYEGKTIDRMETGRQAQDVSLARNAQGRWEETFAPTPGQENIISAQAQAEAPAEAPYTKGIIQINEVMASASPFRERSGYDYVELYNAGKVVNLADWTLTLSGKKEEVFTFPRGTSVYNNEYLIVYFTSEAKNVLATGFSISASYGTLTLRNPQGEVVDVLSWSEPLYGNLPYGRPRNSSDFCFLEQETCGAQNPAIGYAMRADAPVFSADAGFYQEPFTLELFAQHGETIYYTTDGSTPTRNSKIYTHPISITQTTVLRAAAASDTAMLSETAAATYFIGLEIDVPVVSVMIDEAYLTDSTTGMMALNNYEKEWEYPAHIEYFDRDGAQELGQLAGVMVSGEVSRRYGQKSMAFFSRKAYGNESFAFNPFPHRDYESVQAFVLRNAGSEGLYDGIRFMDLFLTHLAINSNAYVSDGQPVLVFVNGAVWGHCNIRERVNKHYFAAQKGITDEDIIDQIDILNDAGTPSNGSASDYRKLSSYMARTDLNDPEALAYVLSQLDVDSLFDYVAYDMICGNKDLSNTRFFRVPGDKWTWVLYDMDTAMQGTGSGPIGYFMQDLDKKPTVDFDHIPFAALMKVPEMKDKFLRRMGEIMAEYFTYHDLSAELDRFAASMEPIMEFHETRWPLSAESWKKNVENIRKTLRARPPLVVEHMQTIFRLSDEQVQLYFGEFLEKNGQ